MITLGIECSSRQGSVALLKNGELLAEKSWIAERVRHNTIFQTLENLIEEADISYSDISLYAVGRGPGSFSGMRMSFAIAQALALPSKTEVRAVSSGAALALHVAQTLLSAQKGTPKLRGALRQIAVVGDARRGQVWIGLFNSTANPRECTQMDSPPVAYFGVARSAETEGCPAGRGGAPVAASLGRGPRSGTSAAVVQNKDWKLVPYEEVDVPEGTIVVSSEAERLKQYFPSMGDSVFPHAKEVAELAEMQTAPEPLEPLYMHPPVFIEPKYR